MRFFHQQGLILPLFVLLIGYIFNSSSSHLITAEQARTCPVVQKPAIYPAVALQQAKHLVFRIHKSNIYLSLKAKPTTGIKKKTA